MRGDAASPAFVPESGAIREGVYVNRYFGMRYPVPSGWTEDLKGPEPSGSGYYSLISLKPESAMNATLLIAAQDEFFNALPLRTAFDFVTQMKQGLDASLTVTEAPKSVAVAGHPFARLEYTGADLIHSIYAIEIRCHIVIFSFTSRDPEAVKAFVASLSKASFIKSPNWPVCIPEYATPLHILHRVNPPLVGPRFAGIPVRIIIDPQGKVAHVHAISGAPEQKKAAAAAVTQWTFKPYEKDGKAMSIETGLLFRFAQKSQ